MARRALSELDRSVWAAYAQHVMALPGVLLPPVPSPVTPQTASTPVVATVVLAAPRRGTASAELAVGAQPGGLDKGSWTRLRTGKMAPTRTLDLHGQTAQRAFTELQAFLHRAQADRVRCVEVITGRGSGEVGGVLRRELPLWLNLPHLRPLVLAMAHPHTANVGSVRLLLRRSR